jgi:PadR family transcriptional regulator PadR
VYLSSWSSGGRSLWQTGRVISSKALWKTLALEPMHGYGIAVRLEQMSKGVFRLNAGSLFVAFQRLQRDRLIRSEWKATENSRRAKYYALIDRGRKRLNSETREWGRQVAAIGGILKAS